MIKKNSHKFKKKYGQNFLQDSSLIQRIVSSVSLTDKDLIIEIGPGDGAMTKELVKKTNVLAYEIDTELKPILEQNIKNETLKIIWGDFLNRNIKEDINSYNYEKLYVIANLPYYITTPIITKIIEEELDLESMVIMVQKEVAERFSALPGNKEYSSITVFLNYYFDVEKLFDVDRKYFYPIPNVDSSILCLRKKKEQIYIKDKNLLFKFIRDSFKFKRKNLKNNLKDYDLEKIQEVLHKYDMDLTVRAENISLNLFIEIVNNL